LEPESNISAFHDSPSAAESHGNPFVYKVKRIAHLVPIECGQTEDKWITVEPLKINQANSWQMKFRPQTTVKLCYDEEFIRLMYIVRDKYVRCLTTEPNGPVHKDSCVEFFFSPFVDTLRDYFNLEINCCGTIKLGYKSVLRATSVHAKEEDLKRILIRHSLTGTIQEEITQRVEWTLEVALPFDVVRKYCPIGVPGAGTRWRANFYKCAEDNSHPHWLSWAPIISARPDFHLPQFFGEMEFC
jgi:hypothetical protein